MATTPTVQRMRVCFNSNLFATLKEQYSKNCIYVDLGGEIKFGSYKASLFKIEYDKQMYRPGYVGLHFSISSSGSKELEQAISSAFLKTRTFVDLFGAGGGKDASSASMKEADLVFIAQYYYIQGFKIDVTASGSINFKLSCYSFDRKLTLSRECKIYEGATFTDSSKGLITTALEDLKDLNTDLKSLDSTATLSNVNVKDLLMLGFQKKSEQKNNETFYYGTRTASANDTELKHPYLVQYNESKYDFLVRTAHKCGEFLYFEHGKIQMGLPESTRKIAFDTTTAAPVSDKLCSHSCVVSDEEATTLEKTIGSYYGNYVDGPSSIPSGKVRNLSYSEDGDQHVITKQDNRNDFLTPSVAYNYCASMFTDESSFIVMFLVNTATSLIDIFLRTVWWPKTHSERYESDHLKDGKGATNVNNLGLNVDDISNADKIANLSNASFRMVEYMEEEAEQRKMELLYNSEIPKLYLGDAVSPSKVDGSPACVVVGMSGEYSNGRAAKNTVTAVPFISTGATKTGGLARIPAPPRGEIKHFVETTPMEAIVMDNIDPLRMGRVRVKYPWQTDGDALSPFIRVSVPFAGGGNEKGGFMMCLSKGEHVMLNYTDGNIERPYVSGSLYYRDKTDDPKKNHLPSFGLNSDQKFYWTDHKIRTVMSGNGHALIFRDMEDSDVLSMAFPLIDVIGKAAQVGKYRETMKYQSLPFGKVKGGGVTLKDGTGICSIALNPLQRNITINSCFGNIVMNAFTGITINAPNGDIAIKGKNISLEAGNNISIVSGKNITHDREPLQGMELTGMVLGKIAGIGITSAVQAMTGIDLSHATDLSFLRSVLEIAIRPVEGTLQVRSRRNLILTAGMGNVTVPEDLIADVGVYKVTPKKVTLPFTDKRLTIFSLPGVKELTPLNQLKGASTEELEVNFYPKFIIFIKNLIATVNGAMTNIDASLRRPLIEYARTMKMIDANRDLYSPEFLNHFYNDGKIKKNFNVFDEKKAWEYIIGGDNFEDEDHMLNPKYANQDRISFFFYVEGNDKLKKKSQLNEELYNKTAEQLNRARTGLKTLKSNSDDFVLQGVIDAVNGAVSTYCNDNNIGYNKLVAGEISHVELTISGDDLKLSKENFAYALPGLEKDMYALTTESKVKAFPLNYANMVKKAILIKLLMVAGVREHVRISKPSSSIEATTKKGKFNRYFNNCEAATSFGEFKKYVQENYAEGMTKSYTWGDLVQKISSPSDPAHTRIRRLGFTFVSNMLEGFGGGIYKYENGKHYPFPSISKLMGYDGVAGPRSFSNPGGNGNILISNDCGNFSMLKNNGENAIWEVKNNPDIDVLKKYLITLIE